ncbi:MAG TPA: hypothetical protein PKM97_10385 [Bacteroidia bacterium]|nr:hypothetical protein [Bacteroidia bacterium]
MSCISGDNKDKPEYKKSPVKEMSEGLYLEDFNLDLLASLQDTICGMSLKDGVADTLNHKGSIYGFCNTGCKNKFMERLNESQ